MNLFDDLESNVRYYCHRWPVMFDRAAGATVTDESGRRYVDFFSGAGALSYGHNDPELVDAAVDHLRSGSLLHSLDVHTPQKQAFLSALRDRVSVPRDLDMVAQFVGPTGATAVEAALALAARLTGRAGVVAYDGGYHGMTDRAAAVSASVARTSASVAPAATFLPHVALDDELSVARLEAALRTSSEGRPGALIIEATQGEGGARPFAPGYLAEVRRLCSRHGVIVIADEVQAGVGRTGPFFSFEESGLDPDIICLSKSVSGLGLPLALNLVRRELDIWHPGEFTGTFRGNNLAFVTGTAMLHRHWATRDLEAQTVRRGVIVESALRAMAHRVGPAATVRGKGLLWGIDLGDGATAAAVADAAFSRGLIVETCGAGGATVKLLPPLVISDDLLRDGLDRLAASVATTVDPQLVVAEVVL